MKWIGWILCDDNYKTIVYKSFYIKREGEDIDIAALEEERRTREEKESLLERIIHKHLTTPAEPAKLLPLDEVERIYRNDMSKCKEIEQWDDLG